MKPSLRSAGPAHSNSTSHRSAPGRKATRAIPPPPIRRRARYLRSISSMFVLFAAAATIPAKAAPADDLREIAALDTAFQAAVKVNDAATIQRILADDMVLVTGRGKIYTAAQHVEAAQTRARIYERQDEVEGTQKVRLYGPNTAIVTALLWIKGRDKEGKAFDYKVWFSDTYVRTAAGWKYVFGQASLPLPADEPKPASG